MTDPNPFFRVPGDGAAAEFVQDPAPAQAPAPAPAPPVATDPVTAPNVIEEQASVSAAAAGSVDGNPPFVLTDEGMDTDPVVYRTGRVIQDDPNSYFGVLRDRRKREGEKWAASVRLAVKQQPDLYAEAERRAKELGLPVDTALANMDEIRELARFQYARDLVVESTNPTLYRSFRNFEFQKKAHDDLANLSLQERWTKGYGKGQMMVERGRIATRIRDRNPLPGDVERLAWIEGEFDKGGHEGFVEWVSETFGQMSQTLPRAIESGSKAGIASAAASLLLGPEVVPAVPVVMGAGFFAGFTSEAFVQSYVVEGGNLYKDMLVRGIDEERARTWSRVGGFANAAIEVGTIGLLSKPWVAMAKRKLGMEVASLVAKPGRLPPFLGEYFRQGGIQTGQEIGQEIVGVVSEWAAAQTPGQAPTFGEAWDRVVGVTQKTLASQSVLGLLPAGAHHRNQAKAAKRALRVQSYVEAMSGIAVDGKLLQRDPKAFEEHHRKLIEDNPDAPSHFYVNARDLGEVLRQKDREAVAAGAPLEKAAAYQIDAIVPGFAAELEQAEAARGDVVIPAEVYLARIAPLPELNGAVAPLLRDDPDGVPLGKAEQILKQAQEEMRQAEADEEVATAVERARLDGMDEKAAMASAGVKGEKAQGEFLKRRGEQRFEASRREVETEIFESFNKAAEPMAGARTSRRERASAAFYASHLVASLAQRAKVAPQEFWKANPLAMGELVDGMQGVNRQPRQAVTDTPEFKAWFGESKVVDDAGKPLVVYHGTSEAFAEFLTDGYGSWFTSNAVDAGDYANIRARYSGAASVVPAILSMTNPATAKDWDAAQDRHSSLRGAEKASAVRAELEAMGFDGVNLGGEVFIAFKPTQIKSVNNRGTFDPNDPNILRQPGRRAPTLASVIAGWDESGISHSVYESGGVITVARIVVPQEARGSGVGTAAMQGLILYADQSGQRIALTPSADFGGSKARLVKFYKRLGFEENTGRRKDFSTKESMVRQPRGGDQVLRQPDRGGYRPADMRLLWTKATDASTLFHELGHWYVDLLRRVAKVEGSSAEIRADWDLLLKRWGVADMAAWEALTAEQQAKHLEDFTYNLEDYLATGKAPTPELQGLFDRIRTWIVRVYTFVRDRLNEAYRKEFGVDLPALTPDLRDVFDRMLASQQAIDAAREERALASLFLDDAAAEAAGVDEATRARLRAEAEAADGSAASDLTAKGLAGVRSDQIRRSKTARERARQVAKLRRKVRAEVETEVRALPEFRAIEHLRGTVVDADGKEVSAKLDTEAVRSTLGIDLVEPTPSDADRQRIQEEAAAAMADNPVQAALRWLRDGLVDQVDGTTKEDPAAAKLDMVSVRAALGLPPTKTVKGKTMIARIRELGGISAEGYPGDLRGEFRIPFVFRKNGGMPWERMAEHLAAEGYGGERYAESEGGVDNSWLLDAMANAAQGEQIYPEEFDGNAQAMQAEFEAFAQSDPNLVAELEASAKRNEEREALVTRLARRGLVARTLDRAVAAALAEERKRVDGLKLPPARRAAVVKAATQAYQKERRSSAGYAAAMFGFQTPEQMLLALADAPLRDEALKAETKRRLDLDLKDRKARQGAVTASARWVLDTLTRNGGQDPDMVAEAFGFESGEQMLRAIMAAGEVDAAIDARTERQVADEIGELLSAEAQERAVEEALYQSKRAHVIAAELQAMQRGAQSVPELMAAAKEAARMLLLKTPVGRITPRLYAAAEARASRDARQALRDGDVRAAVQAQRSRLLQHYLAKQSMELVDEIDAFVGRVVPKVFGDDKKMARTRDFDIVMAARAMLVRHGFGTTAQQARAPEDYLENVKKYDEELWAELDAEIRQATFDPQPWQRLELDRFRTMASAVEHMFDRAWSSRTVEVNGVRMEVAQLTAEMIVRGEAGPLGRVTAEQALKRNDTVSAKLARGAAWLKRFESWALWADGGVPGPFTKHLYRPLANAAVAKRTEAARLKKRFLEIVEAMGPMDRQRIDASEWLGDGVFFDGVAELLGAVLHVGNWSNKNKLIGGYLWGGQLGDGRFDHSKWDAFFLEMQQRGKITEAHMKGIQAIWDLNETVLKPAAQKVNREIAHRYFDEIPATPVQTIWGTFRGGYVPAKPDPRHDANADLEVRSGLQAIQDGELQFSASMPIGVSNKFTITRTGAIRPLLLDLRLAASHIDDALQFIHMQKPVRTVARLLRDQTFLNYLNGTAPGAVKNLLIPMLERTAADRITRPVAGGWLANWMRRSATVGFLAGSMRNILQQFTGIINATHYAPAGELARSAWGLAKPGRGKMIREILEASPFMADLVENQATQIMDGIERQLEPGFWTDLQRRAAGAALWPQAWTQNQVNFAVWHAKYNATLRELGPAIGDERAHAEAVQRADGAVRMSQGSQTALDVANLFGQNAWVRLVTQFGDYTNVTLQPVLMAQNQRERAVAIMRVLVVPSLAASAIALALSRGRELEDDDQDGEYLDEWASFWGGGILRSGAGMVPIVGPAVASLVTRDGRADSRVSPFPAWSTLAAMARTYVNLAEERNWRPQTTSDIALIASAATGIPLTVLGRAGAYVQRVNEGRERPSNWFAFLLGIVNGR